MAIDPDSLEVVKIIPIGLGAQATEFSNGLVWFVSKDSPIISGVDPETFAVTAEVDVGSHARWVMEHDDKLWVSLPQAGEVAVVEVIS
jgi:hypothetical protein